MRHFPIRLGGILALLVVVSLACGTTAPTPDPNVPLTMGNVCDFDNQVVELEGQLVLPRGISCTTGNEVDTCELTFYDPLRIDSLEVFIPVSNNTADLPIYHMPALPDEYQRSDF